MGVYDEIEIEDMEFEAQIGTFFYDCPCGDRFQVTLDQLLNGEDIAECPSCTLQIRVIYQPEDLENYNSEKDSAVLVY
jgi:diphthamide biosynthesis protein 3